MLRGSLLGNPYSEEGGECLHFILGKGHCVSLGVVQNSQALTNCTRSRNVAWSLGEAKTEMVGQGQYGVEIDLREALRGHSEEIIHIPRGSVVTAGAVVGTRTGHSGVERPWERWDFCSVHPNNRPQDPLSGQRRGSIAEGQRLFEPDLAFPSYCEKGGGNGVQDEPSIPALHINFKDKHALVRVLLPSFLDEIDDCS